MKNILSRLRSQFLKTCPNAHKRNYCSANSSIRRRYSSGSAAALSLGVLPLMSLADTSAPASRSISIKVRWAAEHARCSGVRPLSSVALIKALSTRTATITGIHMRIGVDSAAVVRGSALIIALITGSGAHNPCKPAVREFSKAVLHGLRRMPVQLTSRALF
jgi:hypothetical protein